MATYKRRGSLCSLSGRFLGEGFGNIMIDLTFVGGVF